MPLLLNFGSRSYRTFTFLHYLLNSHCHVLKTEIKCLCFSLHYENSKSHRGISSLKMHRPRHFLKQWSFKTSFLISDLFFCFFEVLPHTKFVQEIISFSEHCFPDLNSLFSKPMHCGWINLFHHSKPFMSCDETILWQLKWDDALVSLFAKNCGMIQFLKLIV